MNAEQLTILVSQWNFKSLHAERDLQQYQFITIHEQRGSPDQFETLKQMLKKAGIVAIFKKLHVSNQLYFYCDVLIIGIVKQEEYHEHQFSLLSHLICRQVDT